eukprot:1148924-Pelagomonas_calceolata.AAC.6
MPASFVPTRLYKAPNGHDGVPDTGWGCVWLVFQSHQAPHPRLKGVRRQASAPLPLLLVHLSNEKDREERKGPLSPPCPPEQRENEKCFSYKRTGENAKDLPLLVANLMEAETRPFAERITEDARA